MIHETALVHTKNIGKDTSVWQYVVILHNATIGDSSNICSHFGNASNTTSSSSGWVKIRSITLFSTTFKKDAHLYH